MREYLLVFMLRALTSNKIVKRKERALSSQIKVQTDKLTEFADFLSKKGLIAYEKQTCKIKIKPEWQDTLLAKRLNPQSHIIMIIFSQI